MGVTTLQTASTDIDSWIYLDTMSKDMRRQEKQVETPNTAFMHVKTTDHGLLTKEQTASS